MFKIKTKMWLIERWYLKLKLLIFCSTVKHQFRNKLSSHSTQIMGRTKVSMKNIFSKIN